MSVLICPECGVENLLTANSCRQCGTSLAEVELTSFPEGQQAVEDGFEPLPQAEDDLPGLLHALKHDEDIGEGDEPGDEDLSETLADAEDIFESDEPEEDQVPDWLERIRKRAHEEQDSVGEITQKIVAAKETLKDGTGETHHDNFSSWIESLREQANDQDSGKTPDGEGSPEEPDSAQDLDSDWLAKIRKRHGKGVNETDSPDQEGDSLLQWLVSLEDGGEKDQQNGQGAMQDEDEGSEQTRQNQVSSLSPDADSTQPISLEEPKSIKATTPMLEISREEQNQAAHLSETIVDERSARPIREPAAPASTWTIRLIISVLLFAGVTLSMMIGNPPELQPGLLQPHNQSLIDWAEELPSDASLLFVFDYQPGFSRELTLVAKPVLSNILTGNNDISILSSRASGVLLASRLIDEIDDSSALSFRDLGYYPVAAYGAYRVGNLPLSNHILQDSANNLAVDGYDGIFILSDNHEGARAWVEQLSALTPDTPLNLLVTAQSGPMLMPYWESGQVMGIVSGISEAAGLSTQLGETHAIASQWRSYQVGILLMVALLVIGALISFDRNTDDEGQAQA